MFLSCKLTSSGVVARNLANVILQVEGAERNG